MKILSGLEYVLRKAQVSKILLTLELLLLFMGVKWCACMLALFPGSPGLGQGEPGTFYHVRDVKGRRDIDTT